MQNLKKMAASGAAAAAAGLSKISAKLNGEEEKPAEEEEQKVAPQSNDAGAASLSAEDNTNKIAEEKAAALHKAMEGMGTDEDAIIEVLAPVKPAETAQILAAYAALTKRELSEDLKSELRGDLEKVFLELIKTPARHDADVLRKAMKGMGCDEDLLIEVLCTRDDAAIRAAADEYRRVYESNLRDTIASETGGNLEAALLKIIDAALGNGRLTPSDDEVPEFAKRLYEAGEDKIGTNTSVFIDICAGYTREFVMKVSAYYARNFKGNSLKRVIKSELGGDLENCLLALVTPNDEFYAEKLHGAMKGMGTDEATIIRIVAAQRDYLKEISDFYLNKQDKDLAVEVGKEIGGDAGKALTTIIKAHTA